MTITIHEDEGTIMLSDEGYDNPNFVDFTMTKDGQTIEISTVIDNLYHSIVAFWTKSESSKINDARLSH